MIPPRPIDWANPYTVPFGARPARATLHAEVTHRLAFDAGRTKDHVLSPVTPNAGLKVQFNKRLSSMVEAMHRSIMKWVLAAYRANEPQVSKLAQDWASPAFSFDAPADELAKVIRELRKQWTKRFADGSEQLARYFAKSASKRTDEQLKSILKKAGFSVEFRMTRAQRDILEASINEAVSLIKSIPEQYLKNVEGTVMRSVQAGRDLDTLSKNLQKNYGVTKKRAALIARDQNNKVTAALNRGRQLELGIDEAIWQHSYAGKQPRPSHVAAGKRKQRYKVSEGWYDPDADEYIWPGTLINCRCTSRSVIPGFV